MTELLQISMQTSCLLASASTICCNVVCPLGGCWVQMLGYYLYYGQMFVNSNVSMFDVVRGIADSARPWQRYCYGF